ncbi:hypothetical protein RF371_11770 [Companilactobacillus paralimentarius]|uniref:hypothetical protein n=1 Tax=Companilactobacillus paralimentarius TaxID=83526 RepID=UPI0028530D16|nr:hypothetical protein [Companilactobacillus paralimentarius]MDR4934470.1 hypothetical protein [Companilactobacillus paralimentarius]
MNLTSLISSLIVSGSLGYLNFVILLKQGTINYYKNNSDEKKILLVFFGGMNYFLYLLIGSFNSNVRQGDYLAISLNILYVALVSLLISFAIAPWIVRLANYIINKIRDRKGIGEIDTLSANDYFFQSSEVQRIYVFNLKNELVTCGYLEYSPSTDFSENSLVLVPFENEDYEKNYAEVKRDARKYKSRELFNADLGLKIIDLY